MLSPYFDDPSITTTTTWSSLEAVDPATWYTPAPSDPTLNNLDDHDHDDDDNNNNNNNPFLFNNIIMGPTVTNFTTVPPPHPPHVPADFFSGFAAAASSSSSSSTTTNFSNLPLMTSTFESTFENRPKILRPLDLCPPVGAAPTLFQKRVARQQINPNTILARFGIEERIIKKSGSEVEGGELVDHEVNGSFDGSGFDSDDQLLEEGNVKGKGGKKKGLPAKNLMAERRRRKKLNDRLYLLRSVVPKISKMDRASILGDAIEYLKELLQRINDLHNELESTPSSSSVPTPSASSFHPLTPTLPTLPSRIKEELCLSSLPSPNGQQPRVEVRVREGRAVNIHMFCARKPGLLLSAMKALDGLGLDIQQAVISCFNGFALDVFRAEQFKEGPGALPEEIKAVLLHSAGYQPAM